MELGGYSYVALVSGHFAGLGYPPWQTVLRCYTLPLVALCLINDGY